MEKEKFICPECGKDLMDHFEPMLHYAGPDNEAFNIQLSSPMFKLFTKAIADVFDAAGAINFYTMAMHHIPSNRDFEITVKTLAGKSPAELLNEKEKEITRLQQENERLKGDHQSDIWQIAGLEEKIEELRSESLGRGLQIGQLLQNQAKLIEVLKPFAEIGDRILSLVKNPQYSSDYIKASQTMKEVCGEEENS